MNLFIQCVYTVTGTMQIVCLCVGNGMQCYDALLTDLWYIHMYIGSG